MELTEDQKLQFKMARRANDRIQETWSLFNMYLSQDKEPAHALELARKAVDVWAEFQDATEIEPPEIQQADFAEQMSQAFEKMTKKIPTGIMALKLNADPERGIVEGVDAEFLPEPKPAEAPPKSWTPAPSDPWATG